MAKPSLSPPPKKRKLDWNINEDTEDLKLVDLTEFDDDTTTNTNSTKTSKSKAKYRYTKSDKLSSIGRTFTKNGTDLRIIRKEVLALINDGIKCKEIIKRINDEYSKRARGEGVCYEQVQTKSGRTVFKKMEFLSNIKWAKKVPPGGGGDTNFNPFELCVLILGAFQFVNCYHEELKCDKKLPPWSSGNVGKISSAYVMIMIMLKYGEKYENEVWLRKRPAIAKRTKSLCNKKKTDLDSLTADQIFSEWGKPENVQQTSYVYIICFYCNNLFLCCREF